MKSEAVKAMTDEDLRIKAAELDGWTDVRYAHEICGHLIGRHPRLEALKGQGFDLVPDYTNGLRGGATMFHRRTRAPEWAEVIKSLDKACDEAVEAFEIIRDARQYINATTVGGQAILARMNAFILAMTGDEDE